jgi:hypothetical protein
MRRQFEATGQQIGMADSLIAGIALLTSLMSLQLNENDMSGLPRYKQTDELLR